MVWSNVGFYVVLFGAAMQAIPRDIYEAVMLDGASRWTTLRRITIPLLWDTVQVAWVYLAIAALDGFILVQQMTDGGPNFSSDVIGLRMYDTAFGSESKFGYASAIGVVMFFLTLSVAVLCAARRPARPDRVLVTTWTARRRRGRARPPVGDRPPRRELGVVNVFSHGFLLLWAALTALPLLWMVTQLVQERRGDPRRPVGAAGGAALRELGARLDRGAHRPVLPQQRHRGGRLAHPHHAVRRRRRRTSSPGTSSGAGRSSTTCSSAG